VNPVTTLVGSTRVIPPDELEQERMRGGFDISNRDDGGIQGWAIRKAEDDERARAKPRVKNRWRTQGRKTVERTLAERPASPVGWSPHAGQRTALRMPGREDR
jgi:hypothetical protein